MASTQTQMLLQNKGRVVRLMDYNLLRVVAVHRLLKVLLCLGFARERELIYSFAGYALGE